MITGYQPGKVILPHGEVRARTNRADYLKTKQDVSLPKAGKVVGYRTVGNDMARLSTLHRKGVKP